MEYEVWTKIADILSKTVKLSEVIEDSLEMLKGRQAELDSFLKPINEKLVDITNKEAKLADQWVLINMGPAKYKRLQSNLNKEETMLKSLRAGWAILGWLNWKVLMSHCSIGISDYSQIIKLKTMVVD